MIREKPGFVYMFNFGNDNYKIGRCKEPPERKKNLQTGSPKEITTEYIIHTDKPRQLEKQLHARFKHKRTGKGGKEFFKLNKSDIQYIKNINAERNGLCLLDHMVNIKGQRVKNIPKLSQSHKFIFPSDFQANLPKRVWKEDWNFEKTFQILPYDNLWIESNQREYRWLRLLLESLFFWKVPDMRNTKFYSKNTINFGLWIMHEIDEQIWFTLFSTSTRTTSLVEKLFYGSLKKNGVILSQEQHQRFNCDESHDGYCTDVQFEKCERKVLSHLPLHSIFAREQLIGEQKQKCAEKKNKAFAIIVTVFKALEYFLDSEKIHIIKMRPIQDLPGKTNSKNILSNEWNIITSSNKEAIHYMHGDFEIKKDRKSSIPFWRRAHPRWWLNYKRLTVPIQVKKAWVGEKIRIDRENNKIYELVK